MGNAAVSWWGMLILVLPQAFSLLFCSVLHVVFSWTAVVLSECSYLEFILWLLLNMAGAFCIEILCSRAVPVWVSLSGSSRCSWLYWWRLGTRRLSALNSAAACFFCCCLSTYNLITEQGSAHTQSNLTHDFTTSWHFYLTVVDLWRYCQQFLRKAH